MVSSVYATTTESIPTLSAEATLLTAVAGFPATLALPVPDCVMLFIDVEGPSPVPLKPDGRVILMEAVCSTALPGPTVSSNSWM